MLKISDLKGFDFLNLFPDETEKQKQRDLFGRAFNGENFEVTSDYNDNGKISYYSSNYAPLHNESGEIFAIAGFAKDITAIISAQKLAESALHESKQQSEELRAQEEELRQNMEELSATQEEMQRVLKEAQDKEKYLNELINVPKDSIFTLDKDFKILSYNKTFGATLEEMLNLKDLKGFDFMNLFPDEAEKQKQRDILGRAFNGENFEITSDYNDNGKISYYSSNYAPLRNENGEIFAIAGFAKDVSVIVSAQKLAESALHESKQQEEELRAQEEELRQNMEELSATQEEIQRILLEVQEKESYLNGMMNASTDSIVTVDENMRVISFNDTLKAAYAGYFDIQKGFDLSQVFATPEDKKKYKGHYARVFKGETFEVMEHYSFGEINTYFSVRYSPIRNKEGKIVAGACFATDISPLVLAQKETEKLLQNVQGKEKYLNDLINVPKDSIFTVDKEYKIISYNKAMSDGLEAMGIAKLTGFDMLQLYTDSAEKKKQQALYDRALGGENFEVTTDYENQGVMSHYAVSFAPLLDESGKPYAVACFGKDVTALVSAQKQAEKLLKEAKK